MHKKKRIKVYEEYVSGIHCVVYILDDFYTCVGIEAIFPLIKTHRKLTTSDRTIDINTCNFGRGEITYYGENISRLMEWPTHSEWCKQIMRKHAALIALKTNNPYTPRDLTIQCPVLRNKLSAM